MERTASKKGVRTLKIRYSSNVMARVRTYSTVLHSTDKSLEYWRFGIADLKSPKSATSVAQLFAHLTFSVAATELNKI